MVLVMSLCRLVIPSPFGSLKGKRSQEICDLNRLRFCIYVQVIYLQVNGKIILKSGTDFREFSALTLTQQSKGVDVDIKKVVVDSTFEPDAELKEALSEYEGKFTYHLY